MDLARPGHNPHMRGTTPSVRLLVLGFLGAWACAAGCGGKSGSPTNSGTGTGSGGGSGSSSGASSGSGGNSSGGSSGSSSGGNAEDSGTIGADAGSSLSGTYKGYIQSFTFPDGTDTVVMTLAFAGDTITGTVFFGTGAPLAPPTDPSVGYPPGYTGGGNPLEGFDFTVLNGVYTAPRVQLQIDPTEIWKKWCEIQTVIYPVYNGGNFDGGCGPLLGYGCLPNAATGGPAGCEWSAPCQQPTWTPIDCGKLSLCAGPGIHPCVCTATSCALPVPSTGSIAFDMQLAAGSLNGSETGISGSQVLNVSLTKQ
jgi:hypothetical protein